MVRVPGMDQGQFLLRFPNSCSANLLSVGLGTAPIKDTKGSNEVGLAYSSMGRLHELRGEYVEACRSPGDALEIFERLGTLIEPDRVRKELAELPA